MRVDALVTSGRRPVTGLTAANFELRDNGVLQTITDVHHETLPLNIICALDSAAASPAQPLGHLKEGVRGVIAALGANDRAALLTFADRIELHSALTADRARLRALVDGVKPAAPRRSSTRSSRRWRCARPTRAARCSSSSATGATRPAG